MLCGSLSGAGARLRAPVMAAALAKHDNNAAAPDRPRPKGRPGRYRASPGEGAYAICSVFLPLGLFSRQEMFTG